MEHEAWKEGFVVSKEELHLCLLVSSAFRVRVPTHDPCHDPSPM